MNAVSVQTFGHAATTSAISSIGQQCAKSKRTDGNSRANFASTRGEQNSFGPEWNCTGNPRSCATRNTRLNALDRFSTQCPSNSCNLMPSNSPVSNAVSFVHDLVVDAGDVTEVCRSLGWSVGGSSWSGAIPQNTVCGIMSKRVQNQVCPNFAHFVQI